MEVKIKKLNPEAVVPTYGSAFSAGADLYACENDAVTIAPGETKLIHTIRGAGYVIRTEQ